MRKSKRWQDKLTKKEMKHLADTCFGRPTLAALKQNRAAHLAEVEKGNMDPCFECRSIAIKLGLEK